MEDEGIIVRLAKAADVIFAKEITNEMEASAVARGTGISKRSPELICEKILAGKAVIALTSDDKWVGFQYIDAWEEGAPAGMLEGGRTVYDGRMDEGLILEL